MNDNKAEVVPGVWRVRVYVGRNAKGLPVQQSMTIHPGAKSAKPGYATPPRRPRASAHGRTPANIFDLEACFSSRAR